MTEILYVISLALGLVALCFIAYGVDLASKHKTNHPQTLWGHIGLVIAILCSPENFSLSLFFVCLVTIGYISWVKTDIESWMQLAGLFLGVFSIALWIYAVKSIDEHQIAINCGLFMSIVGLGLLVPTGNFYGHPVARGIGALCGFCAALLVAYYIKQPPAALVCLYCFIHFVALLAELCRKDEGTAKA